MFIINAKQGQEWGDFDFRIDPLNPNKYVCISDEKYPDNYYLFSKEESYFTLPDFKEKSCTIERADVPKGRLDLIEEFESKVLNNKRRIWVYTPAGYDKYSEDIGVAVFTDGWEYVHVTKIITTFDNLIEEVKISPICAVFIESNDDRSIELTCSEKFSKFVIEELLPCIKENYKVGKNKSKNLIAGFSYGGLNAAFLAFKYPEVFSKVICQSGGLYWNDEDDENKKGKILEMYENDVRKPIDFCMTFGELEKQSNIMYDSNQEFFRMLKKKGYNVEYKEFYRGHTFTDLDMEIGECLMHILGEN